LRAGSGTWSRSKLGRIETREQGVKTQDVEQLLDLYQVTDPSLRGWLLDLAATEPEHGYWRAIRRKGPEGFHDFLRIEAALVAVGVPATSRIATWCGCCLVNWASSTT
jgi:Helix-turn-helix domain